MLFGLCLNANRRKHFGLYNLIKGVLPRNVSFLQFSEMLFLCNYKCRVTMHTEISLYSNYIFSIDQNPIFVVGEEKKKLPINIYGYS